MILSEISRNNTQRRRIMNAIVCRNKLFLSSGISVVNFYYRNYTHCWKVWLLVSIHYQVVESVICLSKVSIQVLGLLHRPQMEICVKAGHRPGVPDKPGRAWCHPQEFFTTLNLFYSIHFHVAFEVFHCIVFNCPLLQSKLPTSLARAKVQQDENFVVGLSQHWGKNRYKGLIFNCFRLRVFFIE